MKRSPLKKLGSSPTSVAKREIQRLLREIKIIEQKGICWVNLLGAEPEMGECNEVMQYDHLESRARNISYADPRMGVLVCRKHHYWHNAPNKKLNEKYEELVYLWLPKKRQELWDKVHADNKSYPRGIYEWNKEIYALTAELKKL